MNEEIVYAFASAINQHNVEKICSLMTSCHKFIDSHGNEMTGIDNMKTAWERYFQMFPDYEIEITDIFRSEDTLAAFGFAEGTFKGMKDDADENHWRLPAAWKVKIDDNKISLWQVYADSKIPFDIINRNK